MLTNIGAANAYQSVCPLSYVGLMLTNVGRLRTHSWSILMVIVHVVLTNVPLQSCL